MTQQELKALLISKGVKKTHISKLNEDNCYIISINDKDGTNYEIEIGICDWEKDKVICWLCQGWSNTFKFYDNSKTLSKTIGIYNALKS